VDISLLSNRGFHGSILSATNHQESYKESDGNMANHNVKYSITIALESLIDFLHPDFQIFSSNHLFADGAARFPAGGGSRCPASAGGE
jgi:hypothetical protein